MCRRAQTRKLKASLRSSISLLPCLVVGGRPTKGLTGSEDEAQRRPTCIIYFLQQHSIGGGVGGAAHCKHRLFYKLCNSIKAHSVNKCYHLRCYPEQLQITRGQSLLHLPLLSPATGSASGNFAKTTTGNLSADALWQTISKKRIMASWFCHTWAFSLGDQSSTTKPQVKRLMWFVWQTRQTRFITFVM